MTKRKRAVAAAPIPISSCNIIDLHPTIRQSIAHLPWWNKSTAIGLLMNIGTIPEDAPGNLFDYRIPQYKVLDGLHETLRSPSDARS